VKGGRGFKEITADLRRGNEGRGVTALDLGGLMAGKRRTRPVTSGGLKRGRGHPAARGRGWA
jgi:hypothetical protein